MQEDISRAVIRLAQGGLVAFPTETVYGLGADALRADAVRRVYEVKGRPARNPLIVHVTGPAMARRLTAEWPEAAQRLAEAFWPGPLTLVLPKANVVPEEVTAGGPNVALRAPDHPITLGLIDAFGGPIVGPSANPSGRVSPTTAAHVKESFSPEDVLVLDGGPCRAGIESTVVDLTRWPPTILRPGLVTGAQISRVLGVPVGLGMARDEGRSLASPGVLPQHYAPRARAELFGAGEWPRVRGDVEAGRAIALVVSEVPSGGAGRVIRMPRDARGFATRLYAALREADEQHPEFIAIERPAVNAAAEGDVEVWAAILDRLQRACAPPDGR